MLIVGNFPPPVHGMALVNAGVVDYLRLCGMTPTIVNTSPQTSSGASGGRIKRSLTILRALHKVWTSRKSVPAALYISISGGYGQLYDLLIIAFAKALRFQIIAHHHSYAYLNEKSSLTDTLIAAMGADCFHVVLCDDMLHKLQANYPLAKRMLVLSNAVFIRDTTSRARPRNRPEVLGFLGSVSAEKGIFEFLRVAQVLRQSERAKAIKGVIAGVFSSPEVERDVMAHLSSLPNVRYVGPILGAAKAGFLEEIDVLLFPSSYRNEAEPLTILEALASGVAVITSDRGCIGGMSSNAVSVVPDISAFVGRAVEIIYSWIDQPVLFRNAASEARTQYLALRSDQRANLLALLSAIAGSDVSLPEATEV